MQVIHAPFGEPFESALAEWPQLRARLPHLGRLLGDLDRRQSQPAEALGRSFQIELLRDGCFSLVSPRSGAAIRSAQSVLLNDMTVFYCFPDEPDLFLASSNLSSGFALNAVWLAPLDVLVNLGDPVWGVGARQVEDFARLRAAGHGMPGPAAPPCLVIGDPNFAHQLWNQIGALETIRRTPGIDRTLDIIATHQPLGPIRSLFPEEPGWQVRYQPDTMLEELNAPGSRFVTPGGFRVTRAIQQRVLQLAGATLPMPARRLEHIIRHDHRPVIWLSVRTRNRTAENQVELLASVAQAFLAACPSCCIVLDGHSTPCDLEENPSYDRPEIDGRITDDAAVVAEVMGRITAGGGLTPKQRLVPAVGFNILTSMSFARLADFYFCHHGTVQHKIGWITRAPGVIHCNRELIALDPAAWVADQVEGGPLPRYIPEGSLEDLHAARVPADAFEEALLIGNYRVIDVAEIARFTLAAYHDAQAAGQCR